MRRTHPRRVFAPPPPRHGFALIVGLAVAIAVHVRAWTWPLVGAGERGPVRAEEVRKLALEIVRGKTEPEPEPAAKKPAPAAAPAPSPPITPAPDAPPPSVPPDAPGKATTEPAGTTAPPASPPDATRAVADGPPSPALVLSWPSLADVARAVARHGFALAGIRGGQIVCALQLEPEVATAEWRAPLSSFSACARELPGTLFEPRLSAAGLQGAWLLVPVAIERDLQASVDLELSRRGLAPAEVGAVYGRLVERDGRPHLAIDRVLARQ